MLWLMGLISGAGLLRVLAVIALVLAMPTALLSACTMSVSDDVAAPVSTDVNDFSFESMDVQYTLGRADDGTSTLLVEERFVALFPDYDQNRGMRRSIPDSYLGAPLNPTLVSITDGEGNPRPAETGSEDGYFSMTSRADDYVQGAQTYVFTYTLENVTRFFQDTGVDEFYWDVNGTEWAQDFGRVSARVIVPPDLAQSLTGAQACYVGYQGSGVQTCPITCRMPRPPAVRACRHPPARVFAYQTVTSRRRVRAGDVHPPSTRRTSPSPWGWVQMIGCPRGGRRLGIVYAAVTRRRLSPR